jgi:enediyne biosynthesis protein E4
MPRKRRPLTGRREFLVTAAGLLASTSDCLPSAACGGTSIATGTALDCAAEVLSPERLAGPAETGAPTSSPWFVDVAKDSGLTALNYNGGSSRKPYIIESTGSGIGVFDYNNDGYPDIFMVNGTRLERLGSPLPSDHLFRNNRNGTFTDVTQQAGLERTGWGQGVCVGDYDNDGWLDLFVTYYGGNVLYHNNGDGTFTDVTKKAGLTLDHNYSTGCAFLDYNRDGFVDLFVASYVQYDLKNAPIPGSSSTCLWKGIPVFCGPRGLPFASNHLYRSNRDGTFTDVSAEAGIGRATRGYGFSVLTADLWNRGWPDIYVACDSSPSLLYRNDRNGTFSEVGVLAGVAYSDAGIPQAGMGVAAGDYDGDGFLDIFKTNFIDDTSDLYHNNGDGTFTNTIFQAGCGMNRKFLGWGVAFFDYDNDGWEDVLIANGHVYPEVEAQYPDEPYRERKLLYHNLGNGRFQDVSRESGPGIMRKRSGRGLAVADFDNDGGLEAVINNQNDPPTLLRNLVRNKNHWIKIRTVGTRSNRAGIGTRAKIRAGGRSQIADVLSGGSYLSQNDLRLHFGLGSSTTVESLELAWPSGTVDRLRNLPADRIITVKEGAGLVGSDRGASIGT